MADYYYFISFCYQVGSRENYECNYHNVVTNRFSTRETYMNRVTDQTKMEAKRLLLETTASFCFQYTDPET